MQIDALTKSNAELTKARDDQTKLAVEGKTRVEALTRERENHAKLLHEHRAQIENLTKTNATFAKALEEETKLAKERQTKIDQLAKNPPENKGQTEALKAAQDKLKESEQEGELLLLQLHQVQEELEHYFLQHQDLQAKQELAEARWKRMLERSPEYCDYESLEILPAEGGNDGATAWRVKGLNATGRDLAELEFKTVLEHGIAGFVFTREPGKSGPFIRWPGNAAEQNELTLIPVGTKASAAQRFETLFDLATCDWTLLQTLARMLARELETPAALKLPAGFKPEALRNGLLELGRIIEQFPPTLRYDRVGLKREQVNKDYEHLQLRFENLAFGGKRWPEFEFRLACANIRPKRFGTHPKLEFPEETSQAPFGLETWPSILHPTKPAPPVVRRLRRLRRLRLLTTDHHDRRSTGQDDCRAPFVGAHMPHYRSQARLRLREEAARDDRSDVVVELKDNWHYDAIAHREQVAGERLGEAECAAERAATRRYNELLSDSVFSLCPEGAGPNTLRLWESLAVGAIPVVVAEDWVWPSIPGAGLRWEDAVIKVRRDEVDGLFARLRRMRAEEPQRLPAMQAAGRAVYERFEGVGCF